MRSLLAFTKDAAEFSSEPEPEIRPAEIQNPPPAVSGKPNRVKLTVGLRLTPEEMAAAKIDAKALNVTVAALFRLRAGLDTRRRGGKMQGAGRPRKPAAQPEPEP